VCSLGVFIFRAIPAFSSFQQIQSSSSKGIFVIFAPSDRAKDFWEVEKKEIESSFGGTKKNSGGNEKSLAV
jgi:hypothetical protein